MTVSEILNKTDDDVIIYNEETGEVNECPVTVAYAYAETLKIRLCGSSIMLYISNADWEYAETLYELMHLKFAVKDMKSTKAKLSHLTPNELPTEIQKRIMDALMEYYLPVFGGNESLTESAVYAMMNNTLDELEIRWEEYV